MAMRVADGHVHGVGRLFDGARLEEPELQNAPIAVGQGGEDFSGLAASLGAVLGVGGVVQLGEVGAGIDECEG